LTDGQPKKEAREMTTSTPAASPAAPASADQHYRAAAIALHWIIAALIVVQVCLGWYMNEVLPDHTPAQAQIVTLHISVGLTILVLVLARIGVRLAQPPPPFPADMPAWERLLARATHALFYVLLLALPLTGWAVVSIRPVAVHFWGLPWPKLPGLGFLMTPDHKAWRRELAHIHVYILIWLVVLNLGLHVAGALWGQFAGPPVLWRMAPLRFLKR
jgi:cytochrome b561